jgi:hypothetical protein
MTAMVTMTRQELLAILEMDHGVSGGEVYLLELVPLIEMAWADGPPRPAEVQLLYEFALRRMAELDGEAGGVDVLTAHQVNAFLDRHLGQRPDPERLKSLRRLAMAFIFEHSDPGVNERRRRAILEYCLDIGAASVGRYPYGRHERFGARKKALMLELVETFRPAA